MHLFECTIWKMESKNDSHNLSQTSPNKVMDPTGECRTEKCTCRHNSWLKKYKFEFTTVGGVKSRSIHLHLTYSANECYKCALKMWRIQSYSNADYEFIFANKDKKLVHTPDKQSQRWSRCNHWIRLFQRQCCLSYLAFFFYFMFWIEKIQLKC